MSIRFLSRGPLDQISGGYLYNKYLIEQLHQAGIEVVYHASAAELKALDPSDIVIVDSLVIGETAARLLSISSEIVLLLHVVPPSRELGFDAEAVLSALCRRARLIVTGDDTLTSLRHIGVDDALDTVKIEPGVPQHWRAKSRYAKKARLLLGVANYVPGKGIDRALEALRNLKHLPWTLTVHGNRDLDPAYFAAMRARARAYGLDDRVELLGPVAHDSINDKMLEADLLLHLSEHESFSMVTAEAIACGLPVLSHRTGNADSFVKSGLVRYLDGDGDGDGNGSSTASVLGRLIDDEQTYGRLRLARPWEKRTWQDVGREFVAWLERH